MPGTARQTLCRSTPQNARDEARMPAAEAHYLSLHALAEWTRVYSGDRTRACRGRGFCVALESRRHRSGRRVLRVPRLPPGPGSGGGKQPAAEIPRTRQLLARPGETWHSFRGRLGNSLRGPGGTLYRPQPDRPQRSNRPLDIRRSCAESAASQIYRAPGPPQESSRSAVRPRGSGGGYRVDSRPSARGTLSRHPPPCARPSADSRAPQPRTARSAGRPLMLVRGGPQPANSRQVRVTHTIAQVRSASMTAALP